MTGARKKQLIPLVKDVTIFKVSESSFLPLLTTVYGNLRQGIDLSEQFRAPCGELKKKVLSRVNEN